MGNASIFADALKECFVALGGIRTKAEVAAWIDAHYGGRWKASTLMGHLYGCCVNNPKGIQHHPGFPRFLFAHGNGKYELYTPEKHGNYNEEGFLSGEEEQIEAQIKGNNEESLAENASPSFAFEAHLRDYLARNLNILELGLTLWVGNSELQSVEYDIQGRRIDILARDTAGTPVIIELKVSRGHEKTIGQCLYYRAKLKELLGAPKVRVMIVAQKLDTELCLAATEVPDVDLFEYSLSMTVQRMKAAAKAAASH